MSRKRPTIVSRIIQYFDASNKQFDWIKKKYLSILRQEYHTITTQYTSGNDSLWLSRMVYLYDEIRSKIQCTLILLTNFSSALALSARSSRSNDNGTWKQGKNLLESTSSHRKSLNLATECTENYKRQMWPVNLHTSYKNFHSLFVISVKV